MNLFNNYLKFGEPITYYKLQEAYKVIEVSKCNPKFIEEFAE